MDKVSIIFVWVAVEEPSISCHLNVKRKNIGLYIDVIPLNSIAGNEY